MKHAYTRTPRQTDPAWLDAQYNNRALVPDHATHLARWARESEAVRQSDRGVWLDLPYGSDPSETLDVFAPPGGVRGAPVLVFLHGGYWRSLDKRDHAFLATAFVARGAVVVVPNYALCPATTVPGITLQMVQALAWTWRHIGAYGGDPARLSVVGHSAGGQLAAMMLNARWQQVGPDLPASLVRNALSLSGVFDLEPLRHTLFLQPALGLTPRQVARASPSRLPAPPRVGDRGTLATVVGAQESEEFRRQNRLIRQVWGEDAVPVCEEVPGRHHFSVLEALAEPGHRLHKLALQMLDL